MRALWPNPYVTAGHAILSEYREYERGVTAAVNASVQPVLDRYLTRLRTELSAKGFDRDILVMQGNGGTISSQLIAEAAVNTVMSGPASGVMAAAYTGRASGHPNLITYDMGGTSTDVGLIENAVPQVSGELELEYAMPIHVPMVDVHTIGAGGGSIASVDAAGMLRVGPESAGARPGPICYGRGGTEPTITDANLVLGRLNPDRLLGVDHPVTLDHVRGAHRGEGRQAARPRRRGGGRRHPAHRQRPHGGRHAAGLAVARPRSARLRAVRLRRRGPAACHGAGPRARDPDRAGAGAARHHQCAGLRRRRPAPRLCAHGEQAAVGARRRRRSRASTPSSRPRARRRSTREGVPVRELRRVHTADMQFQGQSHILSVGVDRPDIGVEGLRKAFAAAYDRRFGIELAEIPPVLVNLHTAVIGVRPEISLAALAATERAPTLEGRADRRAPRLVHRRLARRRRSTRATACRSTPRSRARRSSSSSIAPPSSSRATRSARTSSAIC